MEEENLLDINQNFATARKFVESWLGINLTLIELVELKGYIKHTTNLYEKYSLKETNNDYKITPHLEAGLMFMNENYGIQIRCMIDKSNMFIQRFEDFDMLGYDYYPEYFKRVQEEMHFP
jgi:hypothetical protein